MERLVSALAEALQVDPAQIHTDPEVRRGGLSLRILQVDFQDGTSRRLVAKKLHPRLTREEAAYQGPLNHVAVAPGLVLVHRAPDATWLVLEHAGQPLQHADPAPRVEALATLAARIHTHAHRWSPLHRLPWPRPVHVEFGVRHLRGEWRIAEQRIAEARAAGLVTEPSLDRPHSMAPLRAALDALHTEARVFVHGDLHPLNIVKALDGTLRAVDWSMWGRGPATLDLTSLTLDFSPQHLSQFCTHYADQRGGDPADAWLHGIQTLRPTRNFLGLGVLCRRAVLENRAASTLPNWDQRLAGWRMGTPETR